MTTAVARTGVLRRLNAPAWVASETLNVAPNLLGQPLARPSRRALAMAVDGLAVGLLSSTGALWIAAAIAALVFQLRRRQPERSLRRNVWLWLALALLVIMAAQYMVDWVQHWDNPVRARVERADTDDDAGDILAGLAASALPASPASAGTVQSALRIARLEAELEQAKKLRPVRWRDEMVDSAHRLGLGFGWAIAYFTLLPLWWQGQTLGKKALGLA